MPTTQTIIPAVVLREDLDNVVGSPSGTQCQLSINADGLIKIFSSGGGGGGEPSNGDKGDIAVTSSGLVWTIDAGAVSYAKIQNVSATDKLLGRSTAGAGVIEEITCTSPARTILSLGTTDAMVDTLGGSAASGTGGIVRENSPTLITPDIGQPTAGDLRNCTALPIGSGVDGLGVGVAMFLATPSSANLRTAVTDETGSGLLVFATSPMLTTPILGVATATSINKVVLTAPATSATLTIANGQTLTVNGSTTLTNGTHSGTNTGDQTITLTGDVTGTGTGSFATAIAANAVVDADLRQSAALSVIGRSAGSTGNVADIAAGSDGHALRRSGTTLGFGTLAAGAFASNTIAYATLVNSAAAGLSVLGRSANSAGALDEIAAGSDGHVLRRSSSTVLGFGTLLSTSFASNTIAYSALVNSAAAGMSVLGRSANSAGALAEIAAGSDGGVLRRSGTTVGFGAIATAGITDAAVTRAKLANSSALSVIGRTANSSGVPADIAASAASGAVLRESGSTIGFGTIATAGIADTAVTRAKLADATALSVIGRSANSTGVPADIAATGFSGGVLREANRVLGFGVMQLGLAWNPGDESVYFEEFRTNAIGGWAQGSGSGGAAYSAAGSSGHPGVMRVSSGASSGGWVHAYDSGDSMVLTGAAAPNLFVWEACVQCLYDSTGTVMRLGLSDGRSGTGTAAPNNGVYFEYRKDTSANWRYCTTKAGTGTPTTSSTAVNLVGGWVKLRIEFDGTTVTFYVNGTSIGTLTTNLPTANIAPWFFCTQTTAAAFTAIDVDYVFIRQPGLAR